MGADAGELSGPELRSGVRLGELAEGRPLLGEVEGEAVVLVRRGNRATADAGQRRGLPVPRLFAKGRGRTGATEQGHLTFRHGRA